MNTVITLKQHLDEVEEFYGAAVLRQAFALAGEKLAMTLTATAGG